MDLEPGAWLNPPPEWRSDGGVLRARTASDTDFWRETHYGFIHDNGHFFGFEAADAFTMQVKVTARFEALYDQAGLMLRRDEQTWIKAGIEHTDGLPHFSAVVTLGRSDWSMTTVPALGASFWMRLTLRDGAVRIQGSVDGRSWPMLRLAHFPPGPGLRVGPMLCTPTRAGLEVKFSELALGPPVTTDLHDPS
jgi:regulation of enolase protein 1 (concanavalin A-like superfamily)